jgi:zinc protease
VRDAHFQDARICISWPTVSIASPDMYPLDMGAMLLGGGETSRLHRRLVEDEELAFSVGAGNDTPETTGNFSIHMALKEENVDRALAAVDEEIARLCAGGIAPEEMARVIARHRASEVFERETVDGLAVGVGGDFFLTGDPAFSARYLARLSRVEPAAVSAALKSYLVPFRRTLVVILPGKQPAGPAGPGTTAAAPQPRQAPRIERVELPGGARLLLLERHDDPIVAASAAFLGGLRFEPAGKNGVSDFMANMLQRGTARHSAEQLAEILEEHGARLDCYGGRNSFGAWAKFLSSDLDAGLDVLAEVLATPTFPPEEIEKLREKTLAGIRRRRESIWEQNDMLLDSLLYAGHPYALRPSGTEESVKTLTREDIAAFHRRFCRPDNMVLCLAGDFDPAEAKRLVLARFGDFLRPRADRFVPPAVPAMPALSGIKRQEQERPGARQALLAIGFRGVSMANPDRAALDALRAVLSGMGSRLYAELREKQSLAYSVGCYQDLGLDPGGFVFYIATEADKLAKAQAGIEAEISQVIATNITARELSDAKNEILGGHARQQQGVESVAQGMALNELYGLRAETYFTYTDEVEKLTVPALRDAAKKYFDAKNHVIAVTKPPAAPAGKTQPDPAPSNAQ